MKTNEARPLFRVLSFIIALLMWFVFGSSLLSVLENGSGKYQNWELVLGMFIGAVSFSYVAIIGYMPKILLMFFSRGSVADDKDLK
ncbi:hypothetical protein [Shewanella holmiensis]|uniref:Uncharacterized protein n=1 Tax=Shewanella holmiensis TaxID=2952222 RepID=A0A9X2WLB6_9GAMM|nr:hypothetical protein [Shewanella holmiensis]MCT7941385.1 hypothetical protein [Shewanella holmiensis]